MKKDKNVIRDSRNMIFISFVDWASAQVFACEACGSVPFRASRLRPRHSEAV